VVPTGARKADGAIRMKATTPTAAAPPSRKATTPIATVNAHSAVQAAPYAIWALSMLGFRAVAEKARAESASRLRIRAGKIIPVHSVACGRRTANSQAVQ
jgi:hypothetical protein